MKEIVVISGKGGTGKTSITASFAVLAGNNAVLADCDVDAADMHLLFEAKHLENNDFFSGEIANIDQLACSSCGICKDECRFRAIDEKEGRYSVDPVGCEGCGLCSRICPESAITMEVALSGEYYLSETRLGTSLVHAKLAVGASNSGKLVSVVKDTARKHAEETGRELILVDGSPGIGCPVISSLSGAAFVVLVTEPSQSGFSDLQRVIGLVENFNLPAACIINKADLHEELCLEMEGFLLSKNIKVLAKLPYSPHFSEAIVSGKTIVENNDSGIAEQIGDSWNQLIALIKT